MAHVRRNGLQIEYEEFGEGEPVVLIHGGYVGAYCWKPVVDAMLSASNRRVITYNLRGFGGSAPGTEPVTIADQADDLKDLLGSLGLERVHLVSHSYGGVIGLTLTIEQPQMVHSLTLMEPALLFLIPSAATWVESLEQLGKIVDTEGVAAGIDFHLRALCGQNYREYLAPGWWEQVLADASSGRIDAPDFPEWRPTADQLGRITMPVLSVLGGESHTYTTWWVEGHALTRAWFPQAEEFVLPRATHSLHMMNPGDMADALNNFFARHPMSA